MAVALVLPAACGSDDGATKDTTTAVPTSTSVAPTASTGPGGHRFYRIVAP